MSFGPLVVDPHGYFRIVNNVCVCGGALRLSGFVISRVRERPEWRRVLAPARGRGRRLGRISGQRWGAAAGCAFKKIIISDVRRLTRLYVP